MAMPKGRAGGMPAKKKRLGKGYDKTTANLPDKPEVLGKPVPHQRVLTGR